MRRPLRPWTRRGAIVAYNNVIYDVTGARSRGRIVQLRCIYVNITSGAPGSGKVSLYNNTLYDCGARGGGASGAIAVASGPVGVQMDDNLIEALSGEHYVSSDTGSAPAITGANNLLDGAGTAPSYLTGSLSGAPLFAGAFHLTAQSPAGDPGKATAATTDADGNPRPQGAFDVGAYELVP